MWINKALNNCCHELQGSYQSPERGEHHQPLQRTPIWFPTDSLCIRTRLYIRIASTLMPIKIYSRAVLNWCWSRSQPNCVLMVIPNARVTEYCKFLIQPTCSVFLYSWTPHQEIFWPSTLYETLHSSLTPRNQLHVTRARQMIIRSYNRVMAKLHVRENKFSFKQSF